jgi:hypothetical protein
MPHNFHHAKEKKPFAVTPSIRHVLLCSAPPPMVVKLPATVAETDRLEIERLLANRLFEKNPQSSRDIHPADSQTRAQPSNPGGLANEGPHWERQKQKSDLELLHIAS